MPQTTETATAPKEPAVTSQEADFDKRHKKELGVGRFAKIQAIYTLVPLLAAGAAYALGHYVLAKPVAKLLPGGFTKALGAGEIMVGKVAKSIEHLRNGKGAAEAFAEFSPTPEQVAKIAEMWQKKKGFYSNETLAELAEILKIKLPEVPRSVRLGTGAGAGFIGGMAGSIAISYDQWRKAEAARLAAGEIDRDIANMELFKPSDAELVAENKRLRTMVAALPTIDPASPERVGRIEERQQQAGVN